jgi:hypothetical protein
MNPPFIILSLPRSRSFWLSRYLSYREWSCGHDEARFFRGLDDVRSWLSQDCVGSAETAVAPFWRLIRSIRPDTKIVTVRRPVEEVVDSILATGWPRDRDSLMIQMSALDKKLDQIERRVPGVLSARFGDLEQEQTCAELFEHCLPYEHDHVWWSYAAGVNLQVNLGAIGRYMDANAPQLRRLLSLCASESRSLMRRNRKPVDMDGMTFQEESFQDWWRDAPDLLAEHCLAVGEEEDEYLRKNAALFSRLYDAGLLQVMTARSNGKMFGYLVTILSPSPSDQLLSVGTQTTFYASRDAHGLGLPLQRASADALARREGKWEIIQRAGVRGSGPKMDVLFRRMGSEPYGRLYKFQVEKAA